MKTAARIILAWLSRLTPASSPDITDRVANVVMTTIKVTWVVVLISTPKRKCRPALTCLTAESLFVL